MNNCQEKISFLTKKEAQAEATATKWRYGKKLGVYKCKKCSNWHLSTIHE